MQRSARSYNKLLKSTIKQPGRGQTKTTRSPHTSIYHLNVFSFRVYTGSNEYECAAGGGGWDSELETYFVWLK